MTNFLIGTIFGIAAFFIFMYIMSTIDDIKLKKEFGEDFEMIIISKSEMEKYKEYRNKNYVED